MHPGQSLSTQVFFTGNLREPAGICLALLIAHVWHLHQTFNLSETETWLFQIMPSVSCRHGILSYLRPAPSPVLSFPDCDNRLESPRALLVLSLVVVQTCSTLAKTLIA